MRNETWPASSTSVAQIWIPHLQYSLKMPLNSHTAMEMALNCHLEIWIPRKPLCLQLNTSVTTQVLRMTSIFRVSQDVLTPKMFITFFGFWKTLKNGEYQITALFCEPSSWTQPANVTVFAGNQSIISIVPLGAPIPVVEADFNSTSFEYIINAGAPSQPPRTDSPDL